jgi:iron complex outermembrane recepter protein
MAHPHRFFHGVLSRIVGWMGFLACSLALALSAAADPQKAPAAKDTLEEVVVTGTLIPQSKVETATPVTVITADELQVRGFSTIADALQQSAFSTGSVQGAQFSYGFTQGAKTLSMFGLSPSYVKYLIDGLPMSDYPALYNGTDTFTSIGGIPMALVERIDILPGGQSSLYGSDAIAGVINIVLKKKIDGLEADARYGFGATGGGISKTFSIADGGDWGRLHVMGGVQYDDTKPIFGYQRGITSNYNANGTTPQTAERDWLVYGYFGPNFDYTNTYYFLDPSNCANVASQYGGSTQEYARPNRGSYCGTTRSGYYSLSNGNETTQGYGRVTLDVNDHAEVYLDLLASHDKTYFANPFQEFNTTFVNSQYGYYYDPRVGVDLLNLQRIYSPEEIGSLDSTYSFNTTDLLRAVLGAKGTFGESWNYDVSATYNQQKLTENTFTQLTDKILAFYAPIFGPNLGPDPFGFGVSTFQPNYADFYKPITPAQFASFSGYFHNHSLTENTLFRGQLSNGRLFKLPGGDAGIAVVVEGGRQAWSYVPDAGFATGEFFGYTTSGASFGNRTRSAVTTELRLPVVEMLTINASGRYDDYKLDGGHVSKATWNIGLEFRPTSTLLARARVGTAFKAPTLSDEFQGLSGFYTGATDYYLCAVNGYTGANLANCPFPNGSVFGQTSGSTKLKPINASVWNAGVVWAPIDRFSLDIDYLHWKINNEVSQQSVDALLRTEASCRLGQLDITSPTCVAALSQVTRDPTTLQILQVYTPKVNVSQEAVDALTLTANYTVRAGSYGNFHFNLAWNDMLKHTYQQYAGDPFLDLLANPYWSSEFKSKVNGSVTWERDALSSTVYFTRDGRTPNNLAGLYAAGYATPGAGTLSPWTLVNVSVRYRVSPNLEVSGTIINIANAMPPEDKTYNGLTNQPYNIFNFNPYGRSFRLEAKYSIPR